MRTGDAGGEGDPGQDNEQRNLPKFSLLSGRDKKTKFGWRLLIGCLLSVRLLLCIFLTNTNKGQGSLLECFVGQVTL